MSTITESTTLGQLVAEAPDRAPILERLGLDYCCGGKRTLDEACREAGMDPSTLVRMLDAMSGPAMSGDRTDWTSARLSDLVDHIIATHHDYLREALPRVSGLLDRVVGAHADRHPELREVREIFSGFRMDLDAHMAKEERVLFPMIRAIEADGAPQPGFPPTVSAPIRMMEAEHDEAGGALESMRRLTDGYTVPADGCSSYEVLMKELETLEADMHQHVHKENNILFPRAIELERSRTPQVW